MKRTIVVEMTWNEHQHFAVQVGPHEAHVDGESQAGPSPMEYLATGVAGCMAIDVVHILERMRTAPDAVTVRLEGDRREDSPSRFLAIRLHVVVTGDVPQANVDRALQLSRDKYCSAWHSMRQDIELSLTGEIRPAG